jgi:hypothetical protein
MTSRRPQSRRREMSTARAALNRRLPFDRAPRPHDPTTGLPPSRTVREANGFGAPFHVMRQLSVHRNGATVEIRTFYAGAADLDRAVLLASGLEGRAVVMRGDECLFDNGKPIANG